MSAARVPFGFWTATTGTRERDQNGGNEIATVIYDGYNIDSIHVWPSGLTSQAEARVVKGLEKVDPEMSNRFYVGGRQTKSQDPSGWAAVVLGYRQDPGGTWKFEPLPGHAIFVYGDDLPGDHEVIAMDTLLFTPIGPVVAVIVYTSEHTIIIEENEHWMPPSTRLILLDEDGNSLDEQGYSWLARDVRLINHVDNEDWLRAWVIGNTTHSASQAVIHYYARTALGQTSSLTNTHSIANHAVVLNAMTLGPGPGGQTDIFVAGYVEQTAGQQPHDPAEMLTIRFGDLARPGMPADYGIRWLEQHAAERHARGFGIAAAQILSGGSNGTPIFKEHYIFTVGYTERLLSSNPDVYTKDFTVVCYEQEPWTAGAGEPEPTKHWVATYVEQVGDDIAFHAVAARQKIENVDMVTAVVTGVRENEFGEWDWLTVKYDNLPAIGVPPTKPHEWAIRFPQNPNNSTGDDYPVGIALSVRNWW